MTSDKSTLDNSPNRSSDLKEQSSEKKYGFNGSSYTEADANDDSYQKYSVECNKNMGTKIDLKWGNISYSIPANKTEKLSLESIESRAIEEIAILHENGIMRNSVTGQIERKILNNSYGHASPGELVAIMGPSGSGKTSLLNILANRIKLKQNSPISGKIFINGQKCKPQDLAKIGVYIQQEDILIESMTPRQLFTFSAKIRLRNKS